MLSTGASEYIRGHFPNLNCKCLSDADRGLYNNIRKNVYSIKTCIDLRIYDEPIYIILLT